MLIEERMKQCMALIDEAIIEMAEIEREYAKRRTAIQSKLTQASGKLAALIEALAEK